MNVFPYIFIVLIWNNNIKNLNQLMDISIEIFQFFLVFCFTVNLLFKIEKIAFDWFFKLKELERCSKIGTIIYCRMTFILNGHPQYAWADKWKVIGNQRFGNFFMFTFITLSVFPLQVKTMRRQIFFWRPITEGIWDNGVDSYQE